MQEIESNAWPRSLVTGRTSIVEAVKLEPCSEEPVRIPLAPHPSTQSATAKLATTLLGLESEPLTDRHAGGCPWSIISVAARRHGRGQYETGYIWPFEADGVRAR